MMMMMMMMMINLGFESCSQLRIIKVFHQLPTHSEPLLSSHRPIVCSAAAITSRQPPAKKRCVFDFKDICDPEGDQQQSRNELAEYVNLNGNGSGKEWE